MNDNGFIYFLIRKNLALSLLVGKQKRIFCFAKSITFALERVCVVKKCAISSTVAVPYNEEDDSILSA